MRLELKIVVLVIGLIWFHRMWIVNDDPSGLIVWPALAIGVVMTEFEHKNNEECQDNEDRTHQHRETSPSIT